MSKTADITHATAIATEMAASLASLGWTVGDVVAADDSVSFRCNRPSGITSGQKPRAYAARRELRTFDCRGTMTIAVVG